VGDVCDARRSDLGNGAGPALSTREHNRGVDVGLREPGELGCEMIACLCFGSREGPHPALFSAALSVDTNGYDPDGRY
jgi:hypothetical protein